MSRLRGGGVDMMLLIDAGNSLLKWARFDSNGNDSHGGLRGHGQSAYEDDWTSRLTANWSAAQRPERVVVANVRGDAFAEEFSVWCRRVWGLEAEFPSACEYACGVRNAYHEPARLGIDRWAAMIAAYQTYRGPICVFDLGTAITADAVNGAGEHLGGMILPGVELMRHALLGGTHGVRDIALSGDTAMETLLGADTVSGVHAGTVYATVAFIERLRHDLRHELGDDLTVVLTGGEARRVHGLLAPRVELIPDLVLRGVARLANGAGESAS